VEEIGMMQAQRLAHSHEKTSRAAGGIADHILGRGLGQLDHQLNDVARGAELSILPGSGNLREHVFVEIALGVASIHGQRCDQVNHLDEQCGRGDGEAGILHVLGVGGAVAAQVSQEGEDIIVNQIVEFACFELLEARSAEVSIATTLFIFSFGEEAPLDGCAQRLSLLLLNCLEIIQTAQKEQVGDLFNHLKRICDAARPECVPQAVNLIA